MRRESRSRSSFGITRLALAGGVTALLALGGCSTPQQTRDFGLVARDASTGDMLEGVQIFRHLGNDVISDEVVATSDSGGAVVIAASGPSSKWLVMRDGYEPMLVELRTDGEPSEVDLGEVVLTWTEDANPGRFELAMAPVTYRTIWVSVVDSTTGSPVAGATVTSETFSILDRTRSGGVFGTPTAVGTKTDGFGLALVDVPSASTCVLSVTAEGHADGTLTLDPKSDDGVNMHTTVALEAYLYEPTRVVILDRNTGLPVEGAKIRVGLLSPDTGEHRQDSIWTTDHEGMAVVMKPTAGLGTLVVEHDGRLQSDFRIIELHASEFSTVAIGADDLD
jgi:hypothetical protein